MPVCSAQDIAPLKLLWVKCFNIAEYRVGTFTYVFVFLGGTQIRFAHTDLTFPSFDDYRRDCTKDPTKPSHATDDRRRSFTYLAYGGMLCD